MPIFSPLNSTGELRLQSRLQPRLRRSLEGEGEGEESSPTSLLVSAAGAPQKTTPTMDTSGKGKTLSFQTTSAGAREHASISFVEGSDKENHVTPGNLRGSQPTPPKMASTPSRSLRVKISARKLREVESLYASEKSNSSTSVGGESGAESAGEPAPPPPAPPGPAPPTKSAAGKRGSIKCHHIK